MKKTSHYKYCIRKTPDLIGYKNNARIHSDEQITQLASSIQEFGFTNPLLIDEENGIIAGHGRLEAAIKLSMKDVPCIVITNLTKAQKKAYILADNQLPLNATWNIEMLKLEVEGLSELDFDISLIGFDDDFLNYLDNVSDKIADNEELNLGDFDDLMILKFSLTPDQYKNVVENLIEFDGTLEGGLLNVVNANAV